MTPNIVQIQALMPDVGCAGGLPRSLPPRAARSAGVIEGMDNRTGDKTGKYRFVFRCIIVSEYFNLRDNRYMGRLINDSGYCLHAGSRKSARQIPDNNIGV